MAKQQQPRFGAGGGAAAQATNVMAQGTPRLITYLSVSRMEVRDIRVMNAMATAAFSFSFSVFYKWLDTPNTDKNCGWLLFFAVAAFAFGAVEAKRAWSKVNAFEKECEDAAKLLAQQASAAGVPRP